MQFLEHAHQRHAHCPHFRRAKPPEQFGPIERKQVSAIADQLFVHVRQRHHERHRLAVDFGNADQVFVNDRFQLLADMCDLAVGNRHEAPISTPCVVEDTKDQRRFLIEAAFVHAPDNNARVSLARFDDALCQRRKFDSDRNFVGQQVFDTRITHAFDPAFVIGTVVSHHNGWGVIMPLHKQSGFIPDRKADRCKDASHCFGAQPVFGLRDK